ncbi:MAG: ATP-dependent Clp protease proteolytic subunit [Bacteroidetes bacterium]|jgi:ATP-dependent Clp protease protease subunit|nr:ATP-dependent Clp protease proteolytic subunit [Bacteroidota bacterium]
MESWMSPSSMQDDLARRLFESRTILLNGPLTDERSGQVSAQLLGMASASDAPITVTLTVPRGSADAALSLHDVVRFLKAPVRMIATGRTAGPGVLLYVAVPVERRYALPHARFGLTLPNAAPRSGAADVPTEAREVAALRDRVTQVLAEQTGQPEDRIAADLRQQTWLDAEAAVAYGLAGRVVQHIQEVD